MKKTLILLAIIFFALPCNSAGVSNSKVVEIVTNRDKLHNPNTLECSLKMNSMFTIEKNKKGAFEIKNILEKRPDSKDPAWDFKLSDLNSNPNLNGYPYKKTEYGDFLILTSEPPDVGIIYGIDKRNGFMVHSKIIALNNIFGDTMYGFCSQLE